MTLEQAIVIIEDSAARYELSASLIPGKNAEARLRQNEGVAVRRSIVKQLKSLVNEDFVEIDERRKQFGAWWTLKD